MRGRAEPGGDFVVSDVIWPGLAPQPERPLMDTDKYVALVSGLQLANRKADMMQVGCGQRGSNVTSNGGWARQLPAVARMLRPPMRHPMCEPWLRATLLC